MKPFLTNRKSSGTPALAAIVSPPPLGAKATLRPAATGATAPVLPSIEAVKEGDKVVRLIVTCACGERMEVECIYPAGA